jgi:RTX calcium-binding nonapeptide repeat (4 copies)
MLKPSSRVINGTSGDDTLYGDDVKNGTFQGAGQTINGLGGNDILYGDISIMNGKAHGGNDSLNGGDGNDTLHGDAYEMHQNSVGGNDTLYGGGGNYSDYLYGDAFIMDGNAQGGKDILTANSGVQSIIYVYGDAYSMSGSAHGGDAATPIPSPTPPRPGMTPSRSPTLATTRSLTSPATPDSCPAMPTVGMTVSRPPIPAKARSLAFGQCPHSGHVGGLLDEAAQRQLGHVHNIGVAKVTAATRHNRSRSLGPCGRFSINRTRSSYWANTAARGKIILISVNSPGCVSTSIDPPCCLTMMS